MQYPEDFINKIICGDCIEVMRQMPDECVDLVLTDIPYGVVNRDSNGLRVLDKGDADSQTFDLDTFLLEVIRVCSGSIYVFCASEQISPILSALKINSLSIRSCIWEKTNPSPMNGKNIWLSGIEHCAYGKKPGAAFNGHCLNTVWRYPAGLNERHPTEKNLKLIKYLVYMSSNLDDIILDPCIGSGTTGEAAIALGRRIIGVDISPNYCTIAEQRIKVELSQPNLPLRLTAR